MPAQTLEIEWLLRQRCRDAACREHIKQGIDDIESFIRSTTYAGCRLLDLPPEGEKADPEILRAHLDALDGLQAGFIWFFGEAPERMVAVSREQLRRASREQQFQHYANMRHGSFSERALEHAGIKDLRRRLSSTPVAYDGARRKLTLDRALRTCFNTSGVSAVLKENLNAAFAKLVENELVTIWHARLAAAAACDEASLEPLRKLALIQKHVIPFGAVATPKWVASYLVE